ncbi:MAG: hypothetical protein QXK42_07645 [Candidatus Korarchaeum sp.]
MSSTSRWRFKAKPSFVGDVLILLLGDQALLVEPENEEEAVLLMELRKELERGNELLDERFLPLIESIGRELFESVPA